MSSSLLFAFKVSKKIKPMDEKTRNQWRGDRTARAPWFRCTGSDYGLNACYADSYGCNLWGQAGYILCDEG